jgi:CO/xanthine dehydrogenase FAD-binding subunit
MTDDVIEGAADAAAGAIDPVDDIDGPAPYRRALVRAMAARALEDSRNRGAEPR